MIKKRNISKIILVLLATLLILASISKVFADSFDDGDAKTYTPQEFTKNPDGIASGGEIKTSGTAVENVKTVGGKVVGIIQVVGTIVAVGMLIVIGIKYMMGSAEEKAEYKKTLFPYFIGAILIFAAVNLADMVYTWASTI